MNVIRGAFRGESLYRVHLNAMIKEKVEISGVAFDLGCGRHASYQRFLRALQPANLIKVDMSRRSSPNVLADLEGNLPFRDNCVDIVLLFNVLEHIYNAKGLIKEISRVLKKGGCLYLYVPFLGHIHAAPFDYHRYTPTSLKKMLNEAGFSLIEFNISYGIFKSVTALVTFIIPNFIRPIIYSLSIFLDKVIDRITRVRSIQWTYILGIFCQARRND